MASLQLPVHSQTNLNVAVLVLTMDQAHERAFTIDSSIMDKSPGVITAITIRTLGGLLLHYHNCCLDLSRSLIVYLTGTENGTVATTGTCTCNGMFLKRELLIQEMLVVHVPVSYVRIITCTISKVLLPAACRCFNYKDSFHVFMLCHSNFATMHLPRVFPIPFIFATLQILL